MRKFALACAMAFVATHTRVVKADLLPVGIMMQFGVPALTNATQTVDLPHFIYVPVIGSWLDITRPGAVQGSMVFDGLCQDFVGIAFLLGVLARHEPPSPWHVLPWFPQSGGGGLSVQATF
jgi:hypothetical protein